MLRLLLVLFALVVLTACSADVKRPIAETSTHKAFVESSKKVADISHKLTIASHDAKLVKARNERTVEIATTHRLEDFVPPEYQSLVLLTANKHGLNPRLVAAMIHVETGGTWNKRVRGADGEYGLMQIMPDTAEEVASLRKIALPDLHDPASNIDFGCWYYARVLRQSGGDEIEALRRYNAGPAWKKRAPIMAKDYSDKVIAAMGYTDG